MPPDSYSFPKQKYKDINNEKCRGPQNGKNQKISYANSFSLMQALETNAAGTVDLNFVPTASIGKESNRIPTTGGGLRLFFLCTDRTSHFLISVSGQKIKVGWYKKPFY